MPPFHVCLSELSALKHNFIVQEFEDRKKIELAMKDIVVVYQFDENGNFNGLSTLNKGIKNEIRVG